MSGSGIGVGKWGRRGAGGLRDLKDDSLLGVFEKAKLAQLARTFVLRHRDKVGKVFVVQLHDRYSNLLLSQLITGSSILAVYLWYLVLNVVFFQIFENLCNRTRDNACTLQHIGSTLTSLSFHRVCLAGACLSIRKNGAIVSLHRRMFRKDGNEIDW